jgi:sodium-dependent dicarboxylate transporter 2/3/5
MATPTPDELDVMSSAEGTATPLWRRAAVVVGPGIAGAMLLSGAPEGLEFAGWAAIALLAWMATWWITEAVPPAVTALLPLVVLPLVGAATPVAAAAPYADPVIFLFIAGFMLAAAVEKWGLHSRIAFNIALRAGASPRRLLLGFLVATAALSMWISNTATALMMMPIALGVARALPPRVEGAIPFAGLLALAVCYGASIGGIGTPVGSPTNLVAMGFLERNGMALSFPQWMAMAVPVMLAMLLVVGVMLALRAPRACEAGSGSDSAGGRHIIEDALAALGPRSRPETRVGLVFGLVALGWMARPLLVDVPGFAALSDLGVALIGVVALFLVPSGRHRGEVLLDWGTAERIPWGIALLFGGGLSLAAAMQANGVTDWMANELAWVGALGPFLILLVIVALIIFLTEVASNTAVLTALLPVVAALAVATGQPPLQLAVGAAIAASMAFMLPIATPPNAIAYASGTIPITRMMRVGLWLNLIGIVVIAGLVDLLSPFVLG